MLVSEGSLTPPSIDRALKKTAHLPAKNWALAAVLDNGVEQTYTSPGLAPYRTRLFSPRFNHDFRRYVRGSEDSFPASGGFSILLKLLSAHTIIFRLCERHFIS